MTEFWGRGEKGGRAGGSIPHPFAKDAKGWGTHGLDGEGAGVVPVFGWGGGLGGFGGVCGGAGGFVGFVFGPLLEEDFGEGFFVRGGLEFGDGGERAVGLVEHDFFHGSGWGMGGLRLCLHGFREVRGGDLEAVEEEAGALEVEVVGGDAAEDFVDGELDGGAVLGGGQAEAGLVPAAVG